MSSLKSRKVLFGGALLFAVCAAYSNHFYNSFHFDDAHTVVDNPYIRSLHNLPRFFADATTFSVLPANRTYRPMVSASLALDYALGHGYNPFWFHLSTFLVFLLQLAAMYVVFVAILKAARPEAEASNGNEYVSLLAVAWYGLHPAMAETVNYIIQRGDIFCAFGVIAALALYLRFPALRKTGLYLLPFAFGLLSKPPAAVFPLLLFLYIALFEDSPSELARSRRFLNAAFASLPAIVVCIALMVLQSVMTPKTYTPSVLSASSYIVTQPFVLLRYFGSMFLPIHLNVDTDLQPFSSMTVAAFLGFLFVAMLLAAAWLAAPHRKLRPISYGLLWFLIASLPTSLYRLSEVENDHRMFLPFVGLVLAIVWAAFLGIDRLAAGENRLLTLRVASAAAVLLLLLYAYGTHARNKVWSTDETLWLDDVQKCPRNGRGLMNYGLTQMAKGAYPIALDYFQRALVYTPNYPTLEINLGVVYGAMNQAEQAEQHYRRAIALAPGDDEAHFFFGRWLYQSGRIADAVEQLQTAVTLNPSRLPARELLATAYLSSGDAPRAHELATETLRLEPADSAAAAILAGAPTQSADLLINASLDQYRKGDYAACIATAEKALQINPYSALAYNNIGAAYGAMRQWDLALENEQAALRIQPDLEIARNNLALYSRERAGNAPSQEANRTAEDWLNASQRDNQAGRYEKSIEDAKAALRLRPDFAEAYNNIAANYESMRKWDEAIAAAQKAVALKPDFQLAKNNLAWAVSQKKLGVH